MLAIRMQRTGRSGHAQFRVIVQDRRFSPKSGRVTAFVGSYDPHSKAATLDKDKISQYLSNGAQPSDRVARLLKKEGVKLPDWVKLDADKGRDIKHPEKLRKNRPAGAEAPAPAEVVEPAAEEPTAEEAPAVETEPTAQTTSATPTEEKVEEAASEQETPPVEPVAEEPVTEAPTEPEAKPEGTA